MGGRRSPLVPVPTRAGFLHHHVSQPATNSGWASFMPPRGETQRPSLAEAVPNSSRICVDLGPNSTEVVRNLPRVKLWPRVVDADVRLCDPRCGSAPRRSTRAPCAQRASSKDAWNLMRRSRFPVLQPCSTCCGTSPTSWNSPRICRQRGPRELGGLPAVLHLWGGGEGRLRAIEPPAREVVANRNCI